MIDETESLWRTAKESSCTVQRHRWPVREQPQTSLKKMRPPFSCCFPGVGPGGVWLLFTVLTEHRLYRTCGQYYINWMQCKSAWGYKCRKSILLRVTNIRSQTRTACEHILSESRLCSNTHTDTHTSVWIKMTIVRELVLFVWLQTNLAAQLNQTGAGFIAIEHIQVLAGQRRICLSKQAVRPAGKHLQSAQRTDIDWLLILKINSRQEDGLTEAWANTNLQEMQRWHYLWKFKRFQRCFSAKTDPEWTEVPL